MQMTMRWRLLLAAAGLAATLAACGASSHRLLGAFILNDTDVEYSESSCAGTGEYADIREGVGVIVRDQAGTAIGSGSLQYDSHSSAGQCVYRWEVTVGDAESYSIEVGMRAAGTYSAADLNRRYWQVATTIGE